MISAIKGAEDSQGLIVRIYEAAGQATEGTLTLPWVDVARAVEANAVEVSGKPVESRAHNVRFNIEAHQVMTIRVTMQ